MSMLIWEFDGVGLADMADMADLFDLDVDFGFGLVIEISCKHRRRRS